MIINRNKNNAFSSDKIITSIDGVDTEVKKVLILDEDGITESEVFPNPCRKIRIRTNYDAWPNTTTEYGNPYGIPKLNVYSPIYQPITLQIEVEPKNAGWRLISSTGADLGSHTDVAYYGDNTITVDVAPLADAGVMLHDLIVIPLYGDQVLGQRFAWEQSQTTSAIQVELTTPLVQWDFNQTLTSTDGKYTLQNVNISDPTVTKAVEYGDNYGYPGTAMFRFNKAAYETSDVSADKVKPHLLEIDINAEIPNNYYRKGMTVTGILRMGKDAGGYFGLVDSEALYGGHSLGSNFAWFLPDQLPSGSKHLANSTTHRLPNHTLVHVVVTEEVLDDVQNVPGITWTHVFTDEAVALAKTLSDADRANITSPVIEAIEFTNPMKITLVNNVLHGRRDPVKFVGVTGTTELNGQIFYVDRAKGTTKDIFLYHDVALTQPVDGTVGFSPWTGTGNAERLIESFWSYQDPDIEAFASLDSEYGAAINTNTQKSRGGLILQDGYDWSGLDYDGNDEISWGKGWWFKKRRVYQNGGLIGATIMLEGASTYETYDADTGEPKVEPMKQAAVQVYNGNNLDTNPVFLDMLRISSGYMSPDELSAEIASYPEITPYNPSISAYEPIRSDIYYKLPWVDLPESGPEEVDLTAYMKPFLIDNRTVAVSFAFSDFYYDRMMTEYPNVADMFIDNSNLGYYGDGFSTKYIMYTLKMQYEDLIIASLDNADSTITMVDSQANNVPFNAYGWNKYILESRNITYKSPEPDPGEPKLKSFSFDMNDADMAYTVYMKLDQPMVEGETYTWNWLTSSTSMTYDKNWPARSIKINQGGYPGDGVTSQKAFLGSWLGWDMLNFEWDKRAWNPADNPDYTGEFQLRRADTDAIVYTGTIEPEDDSHDQLIAWSGSVSGPEPTQKITGERVFPFSFTDFAADTEVDGEFYIYVPGIGYSWPLRFGDLRNAWSYYIFTRGLMYQHCGDANIKAPYTQFELPLVKQESWYSTGFPTHWRRFNNSPNFVTANGNQYSGGDFAMIAAAKETERAREVTGGYMDAADYDRRPMHLRIPQAIADAYIAHTDHTIFQDGDLNYASSGNGIPDILDEAIWGVEVFRQAQLDNGGVACWIETDRHESLHDYKDSGIRYKIGKENRFDSLLYGVAASRVAKALLKCGTPEAMRKAAVFTDSARRAVDYGLNPDNHCIFSMVIGGTTYTYTENQWEIDTIEFAAAAAIYSLTKDPKYLEWCTDEHFKTYADRFFLGGGDSYRDLPCGFVARELKSVLPNPARHIERLTLKWAEATLDKVNGNKYDIPHHATNVTTGITDSELGYDDYIGGNWNSVNWTQFGGGHVDTKGYWFVEAYRLTKDQKWKDAIQDILGFNNGANPLGQTMTTGIGYCNQTYMLNGYGQYFRWDDRFEPLPGLSPYEWGTWNEVIYGIQNSGTFSSGTWGIYNSGYYSAGRRVMEYVNAVHLPGRWKGNMSNDVYWAKNELRGVIPKFRLSACRLGSYHVPAGEYTVWETMAYKVPLAMELMTKPFTPPAEWAAYRGPTNRWEIDGHLYLG